MRFLLIVMTLFLFTADASTQSFTCSYGKRAACLDYSDKVCSLFSKCISSDAVCFDSYTCDYNGFVCKSDFNEIVDKYDGLVTKHNDLISRIDSLEWCLKRADDMEDVSKCMRRF